MKTGIQLIAKERKEQLEKHSFGIIYDVEQNNERQLQIGAIRLLSDRNDKLPPDGWNRRTWKKMSEKGVKDRLIIAGALISAEIDRLQLLDKNGA